MVILGVMKFVNDSLARYKKKNKYNNTIPLEIDKTS